VRALWPPAGVGPGARRRPAAGSAPRFSDTVVTHAGSEAMAAPRSERSQALATGAWFGVLGGGPAPRHQREAADQPGVDRVEELSDGDLADQLTSLLSTG